ncbi:MAG: DUF192 domain-containing protein [Candidatus Levybacteria bacterium]|nr:DUF192 domain-containing protein [Candidatus Levybacteria bacterium]
MKIILALFALLVAVVAAIPFSQNYLKNNPNPFAKKSTATIKDRTFQLLLAKTPEQQQIGLSEHKSFPKDQGMLFIFASADYHPFWMKNMKIPIDMLFIKENKIVTIYDNVQPAVEGDNNPPIYRPQKEANRVLEINAGLSKEYDIKIGDEVRFENL